MDYRHSTKGKNHLRLSAKRKKSSEKIKILLQKRMESKTKSSTTEQKTHTVTQNDHASSNYDPTSRSSSSHDSNADPLNNTPNSSSCSNYDPTLRPSSSRDSNADSLSNTPNSSSCETGTDLLIADASTKSKKCRRKLTLSTKRKKRVVNIGLLQWNMQRSKTMNNSYTYTSTNSTTNDDEQNTLEALAADDTKENIYDFVDDDVLLENSKTSEPVFENVNSTELQDDSHSIIDELDDDFLIEAGPKDPGQDPLLNTITGRFIVDGQHFLKEIRSLENHRNLCLKSANGVFSLVSWSVNSLVWKVKFQCHYCKTIKIVTSEPSKPLHPANTSYGNTQSFDAGQNRKLDQLAVVDSAVWGFMSIGGGHSNMEEVLTTMAIKSIDKKTFQKIEMKLGTIWKEILFDTMVDAGQKERSLAIENGDVTSDGTPFITVVVDGGWSHRSHGHRYDANSGVSCVIGLRTKKLLHLDIRNKYCAMCQYLERNNKPESHDHCFKNWSGSSSAMEPDMLVQAFRQSKTLHGLEYRSFIGDGDSSVHKRLNEMVPYGRNIEKIECANHVIKNYTKALFKIHGVAASVRSVLSRPVIKRLSHGARSAIIYNAKNGQNPSHLREDLRNGPFHVFGVHENCKSYFCKTKENEGSLNGNRLQALHYVQECLKPLLRKAHQLISNKTSNLAENVMSLVAKFVGGKQVNRSKKGSYTVRAQGAGLDFQLGPMWHYETMKKAVGKSPPSAVKRYGQTRLKRLASTRKCLFGTNKPKGKKKVDVRGQEDYGEFCQKLDMEPEELEKEASDLVKSLQVTMDERDKIEEKTRGQSDNDNWFRERKNRLTASVFGSVAKRREKSKWATLVNTVLYGKTVNCAAIEYGKVNEKNAIETYSKKTGQYVRPCGLFVDLEYGYLGASPDGLVEDDGIVEIKCPKSAENMSINEAVQNLKNLYLDKNSSLKKTHNYYYQVQGQLHITGKQFCDFVVWTKKDMLIQRIYRDEDFWQTRMFPKLRFFYEKAILPEIVDPRKCRNMDIREPAKE